MSTPIKTAIFARLTGAEDLTAYDSALAAYVQLEALLTHDINTGDAIEGRTPADVVFQGNKNDAPLLYPLITFHSSEGGTIDQRFADGTFAVEGPIIDVEIWDDSRSGTLVSDIDDCVARLLDRRRGAPPLPLTSGIAYYASAMSPLAEIYDSRLRAWFGAKRYKFVEGR